MMLDSWKTHAPAPEVQPGQTFLETILDARPVQDANLPALQQLLNQETWSDPYAGSAAYYGMTGRNGLWIVMDDSAFMLIATHPNEPGKLLLFPPRGEQARPLLSRVIKNLAGSEISFQLARFPAHMVGLAGDLTADAPAGAIMRSGEDTLDWRFPVHVLDAAKVADHQGPTFSDFRNNVRRVPVSQLSAVDLHPEHHRAAVRSIVSAWASSRGLITPAAIEALCEPYSRLLELMTYLPIKGRLYRLEDQPAAFAIWEETDRARGIANSFAAQTNRMTKGMNEFIQADTCRLVRDTGFAEVCIGGSEDAGLDAFKRKMRPIRSIPLTSVHFQAVPRPHLNATSKKPLPAFVYPGTANPLQKRPLAP